MDQNPRLTATLLDHMPPRSTRAFGFSPIRGSSRYLAPDQATLYATALLTLLACAGTVVPLYLLARAALPASASWAAAALWPLAPSANLFQPVADTAYPLLSTSALALAVWAVGPGRRPRRGTSPAPARPRLGNGHGVRHVLLAGVPSRRTDRRAHSDRTKSASPRVAIAALLILRPAPAFLRVLLAGWALTAANPFVIGSWNLKHHAQFYVEYPRTYWLWLWVNPVEMAIASACRPSSGALLGFSRLAKVPVSAWSTLLVLVSEQPDRPQHG